MEFLTEYAMFLAKAVTFVFCALIIFGNILPFGRDRDEDEKGKLKVCKINERYESIKEEISHLILSKQERKQAKKALKQQAKEADQQNKQASKVEAGAEAGSEKPAAEDAEDKTGRIYYLNFKGDVQAKAANALREEITAILGVATDKDEVLVNIESPGGVVHGYGFAASQLDRVRKAGIKLTAVVDKVAASGGYMMACVADEIYAAPFAIIGSVGVVAQIPNFHRLLDKNDVDFELHTAGEHKRTLTMFGENTDEGREKFKQDLEEVHLLFKDFIAEHRPELDVDKIATGEIWLGTKALEVGLVDSVATSDEYLFTKVQNHEVYEVKFEPKKSLQEKLSHGAETALGNLIAGLVNRIKTSRYFS